MVGQYELHDEEEGNLLNDGEVTAAAAAKAGVNPELLEYGTNAAKIVEYYITDDKGIHTTAVIKGQEFTIHMKVDFAEDVPAPIFAFTIKNIKGTEITGTNTMVEKAFLESVKAGGEKGSGLHPEDEPAGRGIFAFPGSNRISKGISSRYTTGSTMC